MPPLTSKEAKAKRLQSLRALTGLSRRAVARKYGMSENTLKNWEYANQSGLTENGARLMVGIFQKENIDCSVNWLLTGKGTPPRQRETDSKAPAHIKENPDNAYLTVQDEINDFKKRHSEAVAIEIKDDSMLPFYRYGDIVAGIRHYSNDISKLIGKDCIVETKKGEILLKTLIASTIPHKYNLYSINSQTRIEKPYHYDVEVTSCAPVIWIRRGKKW